MGVGDPLQPAHFPQTLRRVARGPTRPGGSRASAALSVVCRLEGLASTEQPAIAVALVAVRVRGNYVQSRQARTGFPAAGSFRPAFLPSAHDDQHRQQ